MIVGADDSSDRAILGTADTLYRSYRLKRVYYSAFSPIQHASAAPAEPRAAADARASSLSGRLAAALYGFSTQELFAAMPQGHLDLDIDPEDARGRSPTAPSFRWT